MTKIKEFFKHFALSFLVLFFLYVGLTRLGVIRIWHWESVWGLAALSTVVSLLIAFRNTSSRNEDQAPKNFWDFIHLITVREPSSLAILLFIIAAIGIGTFYFASSLFKAEYTEFGFQFKLPGQTIYYVPIIPTYDGWQNTGIELRKGDSVEVAIIGYASTDALWGLIRDFVDRLKIVKSVDQHMKDKVIEEIFAALPSKPDSWTGPEGFGDDRYPPPIMPTPGTLVNDGLSDDDKSISGPKHYKDDTSLTVPGLPHNTIVGIIFDEEGQPEFTENAYEYTGKNNKDRLVNLSQRREQYPMEFRAKWSGTLWVIVNDAYQWRWDNSGMFFMSVKVHTGCTVTVFT